MASPPALPEPGPDRGPESDERVHRWILIRDLLVFSAKAAIEALRDIVLIPVAFLVGIGGLLLRRSDPERPFHDMLRLGRRFDDWLNLFGGVREERERPETVDGLFDRVEAVVLEQHERGGITTSAKQTIDRALDRIQRSVAGEKKRKPPMPLGRGEDR